MGRANQKKKEEMEYPGNEPGYYWLHPPENTGIYIHPEHMIFRGVHARNGYRHVPGTIWLRVIRDAIPRLPAPIALW